MNTTTALNGLDLPMVFTIVVMTLVTLIARSLFSISDKPWKLPRWAQRGLHYAPIAALAAIIVPEVVMTQAALITTVWDARIFGFVAGALFYFWRKQSSQAVLGTIVAGMAVYVPLHVLLGW